MDIHGHCDPAFTPVRDAFAQNFAEGLELGASVAVTHQGRPVVDLWAGDATPNGDPWREDTIVNVYSTTKTMAAVTMHLLADRGQLDFDAPVATYWPEFAQNGKDGVRVRHVMSHSTGLSGFDPPLSAEALYDRAAVAAQLAAQTPWWEPGTAIGYHAITQGQLEGEIVQRITGRSLGEVFRSEIAEPLGADFHIGLDAQHDARVAELIPPEVNPDGMPGMDPTSIAARTFASYPIDAAASRTRAWRAAEIPAANGHGNARSIARVHGALVCGGAIDGVRILSPEGAQRVLEPQIDGVDLVIGQPVKHGLGLGLGLAGLASGVHPRSAYWGGWGGSLAYLDFDAGLAVGYAMNRMDAGITGDVRATRLLDAVYQSRS